MAKPILHNKVNKEELKLKVLQSDEQRVTISFYKYHTIGNPVFFRDYLFLKFNEIGVLGRIYVAFIVLLEKRNIPTLNLL